DEPAGLRLAELGGRQVAAVLVQAVAGAAEELQHGDDRLQAGDEVGLAVDLTQLQAGGLRGGDAAAVQGVEVCAGRVEVGGLGPAEVLADEHVVLQGEPQLLDALVEQLAGMGLVRVDVVPGEGGQLLLVNLYHAGGVFLQAAKNVAEALLAVAAGLVEVP